MLDGVIYVALLFVAFCGGYFLRRWVERRCDGFDRLPLPDDPPPKKYPSKKLQVKKAVRK